MPEIDRAPDTGMTAPDCIAVLGCRVVVVAQGLLNTVVPDCIAAPDHKAVGADRMLATPDHRAAEVVLNSVNKVAPDNIVVLGCGVVEAAFGCKVVGAAPAQRTKMVDLRRFAPADQIGRTLAVSASGSVQPVGNKCFGLAQQELEGCFGLAQQELEGFFGLAQQALVAQIQYCLRWFSRFHYFLQTYTFLLLRASDSSY